MCIRDSLHTYIVASSVYIGLSPQSNHFYQQKSLTPKSSGTPGFLDSGNFPFHVSPLTLLAFIDISYILLYIQAKIQHIISTQLYIAERFYVIGTLRSNFLLHKKHHLSYFKASGGVNYLYSTFTLFARLLGLSTCLLYTSRCVEETGIWACRIKLFIKDIL